MPLYRHHKFSLSIIGICLIVIIVLEYIFIAAKAYLELAKALAYIIVSQILISFQDSIEKYLFEYDYMNPFVVLMYEGVFGFALTFFFFFFPHYFQDVKELFTETKKTLGTFILFIFVLFLYIILSGLKNIFRIVTNKIYSPMAKMLTDYFLNPLYFIYYCISLDDFKDKKIGKINIIYKIQKI